LQVNAFGTAHILVNSNPASVVVPNDALHWQWEIGREVVFLPSGDGRRFVPRVVRKGVVRDGYVQIIDGVNPGDQVVTAGSRILSSELSKLLEKRLGDNAEAVRDFSGVLDTTRAPQIE
jgi:cobalt-zinc-cadmium efflux system membrane fusion protein